MWSYAWEEVLKYLIFCNVIYLLTVCFNSIIKYNSQMWRTFLGCEIDKIQTLYLENFLKPLPFQFSPLCVCIFEGKNMGLIFAYVLFFFFGKEKAAHLFYKELH